MIRRVRSCRSRMHFATRQASFLFDGAKNPNRTPPTDAISRSTRVSSWEVAPRVLNAATLRATRRRSSGFTLEPARATGTRGVRWLLQDISLEYLQEDCSINVVATGDVNMQNTLRIRRAELRVSQRKLAKQTRIEVTRLWKLENDYAEPTPEERRSIADALGTTERRVWTATSQAQVA